MTGDGDWANIVYLGHSVVTREEYEKMNNFTCDSTYINNFENNETNKWWNRAFTNNVFVSGISIPVFRESKYTNDLRLSVDLPGVEQKDLKLVMEGPILKVQYSRIDEGANRWISHYIDPQEFDIKNVKTTFKTCILDLVFVAIKKPELEITEIEIGE